MRKGIKKRLLVIFTLYCVLGLIFVVARGDSFLPNLNDVLGEKVPLAERLIPGKKTAEKTDEDGRKNVFFHNVQFDEYETIGKCFGRSGFVLETRSLDKDVLTLTLSKGKRTVDLRYNMKSNNMTIIYPRFFTEDSASYDGGSSDASIFPDLRTVAGPVLPRISTVLEKEPDLKQNREDELIEKYKGFTEEHYKAISDYLQQSGCSVTDYRKDGKRLVINLEKEGKAFILEYDPENKEASMRYPVDVYIEPLITNTPVPTATPAPTISPDEYYQYAVLFTGIIKSTLKNPASLQVHSIRIMGYEGDSYVVIDFSAMNELGGFRREVYSFKFEKGHISLSGNSSDYDMYSKHKRDFYQIESLDVDAVMSLVNK